MKFTTTFNFFKDRLPAIKGNLSNNTTLSSTEGNPATVFNCTLVGNQVTPKTTLLPQNVYFFLGQYSYAVESQILTLPTDGSYNFSTYDFNSTSNVDRITYVICSSDIVLNDITTILAPQRQFIVIDVWMQGVNNGFVEVLYYNIPLGSTPQTTHSFVTPHNNSETLLLGINNDQTLDINDHYIKIIRQSDNDTITIPTPFNASDVKCIYGFSVSTNNNNPTIDATNLFSSAINGFQTQVLSLDVPINAQDNQRWKYQGPSLTYNGKVINNNDIIEFVNSTTSIYITKDDPINGNSNQIQFFDYAQFNGILTLFNGELFSTVVPSIYNFNFDGNTGDLNILMNDGYVHNVSIPLSLTNAVFTNFDGSSGIQFQKSDGSFVDVVLPVTSLQASTGISIDLTDGIHTFSIANDASLPGNPTTTTQLTTDNSTRIATTEFVQTKISEILGTPPITLNTLQDVASFATTAATDAEVAAKAYADLLLSSAIKLRGGYDASSNLWPSTGGSGTAGAIKAGDLWFVSVPGTLAGKAVVVGDSFFAVVDAPGQTASNWCALDTNLGFVPEEAGTAAAAITAHLLASDPHGDRSYTDTAVSSRLRFDAAQSLTDEQALQARQNIKLQRTSSSVTTASLPPQNYQTGTITLARASMLMKITTDYPARVRFYDTLTHRNNDVNRAVGVYPADDSGCLFEFITTSGMLTASLNTPVFVFNDEAVISTSIAYTITNLDVVSRAITVTINFMPME